MSMKFVLQKKKRIIIKYQQAQLLNSVKFILLMNIKMLMIVDV